MTLAIRCTFLQTADIWAFGDSTSLVRGVRMRFDLSIIDGLLQDECDRQKWNEPVLLLYDGRIREIANLIWQECQTEEEHPRLYGESLTVALISCLFHSSHAQGRVSQFGLSRIQLKRTVEYMQASLLRDVGLKELASVAGLSPSHFGRAFKASTGSDTPSLDRSAKSPTCATSHAGVGQIDCHSFADGRIRDPEPFHQGLPRDNRRDTQSLAPRCGRR